MKGVKTRVTSGLSSRAALSRSSLGRFIMVTATLQGRGLLQGLSQDLETGCLKLAIVKFLGVQILRGYHNILRFQPLTCIHLSK